MERRRAEDAEDFFYEFSPWENAQLGCVHDFLGRLNVPRFNKVARDNFRWADGLRITINVSIDRGEIQHLMSLGLEWILNLTQLTTEDTARALKIDPWLPTQNDQFLETVLWETFKHEDPDLENAPSFFDDGDDGP